MKVGPPAASFGTGSATTISSCRSDRLMAGRSCSPNTLSSGSTRMASRTADYWQQNVAQTRINYEYCVENPVGCSGYGRDCWGLTASTGEHGYAAFAPGSDLCVIAPTAALSSMPYAPELVMPALRHFYEDLGDRLWGEYGFIDAFSLASGWYSSEHLAVNQGPIVVMIENFRTGLLWDLFMSCREVQTALGALGFESPRLPRPASGLV
jgi:hypothetical protein